LFVVGGRDNVSQNLKRALMEPIQSLDPAWGDAGTTSAMGFPNRVTEIGFFVSCT
jgi:hypothetical protein